MMHDGVQMLRWRHLFAYVEARCRFRCDKEMKEIESNCQGDLRFSREFCSEHGLDWAAVRHDLIQAHGFCDCEVIFNAKERLPAEGTLPLEAQA